jgi:Ice-binding-like
MGFAAFLLGPSHAFAQVSLGAAQDFAALGGSAVTCTRSAVEGDVGVDLGGAVTGTLCAISSGTGHEGDTVAQQAYDDSLLAYDAIGRMQCDVDLTGQPLVGQSLTPGVYCFDTAVTQTGGVLALVGSPTDTWIFKVGTSGVGALTGTNFSVIMPGGTVCNNNVFWWTAHAATLTDSVFVGTILSGRAITITRGSSDGQALANAAVTLTDTFVCG